MRTQPAKTVSRAITFRPLLLAAMLLIVSTATLRAQSAADSISSNDSAASVKHLGNIGANMVFQVLYANPTGERFVLQIKDKDNTTLYQEVYSTKKFDKKFRVPKAEEDQLTFIIKGTKHTIVLESFEVNTHTRVVDEFVVQKMN